MMPDDKIEKAAAALLRERDPAADPRLPALARGELTAEEAESLQQEALAGGRPALAYEAFRPLDEEERGELTSALLAKVGPKKTKPIKRRRAALALAFAAAAALMVIVYFLRAPPPLPQYVAAVELDATSRGEPQEAPPGVPIEARAGSDLRLRLRPATAASGPIATRVFVSTTHFTRPWPAATVEERPHGGIFVRGSVDAARALAGRADAFRIAVVLGRQGTLPDDDALAAALGESAKDEAKGALRIVWIDVRVRESL